MALVSSSWLSLALCIACLATASGAPTHTPEVSAVLLTRLRRASAPAGMSETLNGALNAPQDPHKRSYTLDNESVQLLANTLKDEENLEPSQNGGSFSPVAKHGKGNKISSLPEFNRIPSLSNNCPTCVPDSFRWSDMD